MFDLTCSESTLALRKGEQNLLPFHSGCFLVGTLMPEQVQFLDSSAGPMLTQAGETACVTSFIGRFQYLVAVINCSSEPGGLRLGAVEAAPLQLFGPEKKTRREELVGTWIHGVTETVGLSGLASW